jgi:hypothetical protein
MKNLILKFSKVLVSQSSDLLSNAALEVSQCFFLRENLGFIDVDQTSV